MSAPAKTKGGDSISLIPMLVLFVIVWLGATQFMQTGKNVGGGIERVSREFKDGGSGPTAEDGLPIIDGSQQRQPLVVPKGGIYTFYSIGGKFRAYNHCGHKLELNSTETFTLTPLNREKRLYEFYSGTDERVMVTLTDIYVDERGC